MQQINVKGFPERNPSTYTVPTVPGYGRFVTSHPDVRGGLVNDGVQKVTMVTSCLLDEGSECEPPPPLGFNSCFVNFKICDGLILMQMCFQSHPEAKG